jgi:N-acylneuraminate cytidylyltransferase
MRIIGLIPARGGSKGIPKKNLQKINGVSLLEHKITQVKKSVCDEVWVSTENDEIKKMASESGANIIDRPSEYAADDSGTKEVIFHAIKYLGLKDEDIIVILQTTSPLIKLSSINKCVSKLLNNKNFASVITIHESNLHIWTTTDEHYWYGTNHNPEIRKRRQELDKSGWETGGCYAIKIKLLQEKRVLLPEPVGTINVSYLEALDIDTMGELEIAANVLKHFPSTHD